jgi:hypothetical protein
LKGKKIGKDKKYLTRENRKRNNFKSIEIDNQMDLDAKFI